MGFAYIAWGLVFFVNPVFSVVDFLPDFIGCILILIGMKKLRDLSPSFSDTNKYIGWLLCADVLRFLSVFIIGGVEDKTTNLLFTFSFDTIETALILFALVGFFDGMSYISVRHGGTLSSAGMKNVKNLSIGFFLTRAACNILPELKYLSTADYEGYITAGNPYDIANFGTIFLFINIIVSTVFGIVWLIKTEKYFRSLMADKTFLAALDGYYESEISTNKKLFYDRRLNAALALCIAGIFFMADLTLDGINIIPDFIGAAFFIAAFLLLLRETKLAKTALVLSSVYFAANLGVFFYMSSFGRAFYYYGIGTNLRAYRMFRNTMILSILDMLIAIAVFTVLLLVLRFIIDRHTGIEAGPEFVRIAEGNSRLKRSLKIRGAVFLIFTFIMSVSSIIQEFLTFEFAQYWIIHLAIQVLWVIYSVIYISHIRDGVRDKYFFM